MDPSSIDIAVVGAHMRGFPLNKDLTSRGGVFQHATSTSASYRLFALANTFPHKPGLSRALTDEDSGAVEVEIWRLPKAELGGFLETVPSPLGIGTIELRDGNWVKGFICEPYALHGATEITGFGGWRAYTDSLDSQIF
ncbi:urea amidolyase subunit 1 [Pestalotiopsis sp. NC0098]|nr:urea amidolyase subunit 1 [Pestalotiopsis sp. NC0098]